MMKLKIILLLTLLSSTITTCQGQNQTVFYELDEIEIFVGEWELLAPYNHTEFLQKVGSAHTKFTDKHAYPEFQWEEYEYEFNASLIMFSQNEIADIFIRDASLSINGIKIGDSIDKVKQEFSKWNANGINEKTRITIWYGDFPLSFYYSPITNKISKITYIVPL